MLVLRVGVNTSTVGGGASSATLAVCVVWITGGVSADEEATAMLHQLRSLCAT